jgi:hypothetical protein
VLSRIGNAGGGARWRRWIAAAVLAVASLRVGAPAIARAEPKKKAAEARSSAAAAPGAPKVKTYEFSGLDVAGRLKTPQLLYFLHRMEAELDDTTPARRSFLPELVRSTDEM